MTAVVKDNLKLIVFSAKRLSNLINDILDMSRLQNNDFNLQVAQHLFVSFISVKYSVVNLATQVDAALSMAQLLLKGKSIKLINDIDPQNCKLECDENRLQQILMNLIGN